MQLRYGLLCNHACFDQRNQPVIVGVFQVALISPDAPIDQPIALAPFFVVLHISATSYEAGRHPLMLRFLDGDGTVRGSITFNDLPFVVLREGYGAGVTLIHAVTNLVVPTVGDYVFELLHGIERVGSVDLAVAVATPEMLGQR